MLLSSARTLCSPHGRGLSTAHHALLVRPRGEAGSKVAHEELGSALAHLTPIVNGAFFSLAGASLILVRLRLPHPVHCVTHRCSEQSVPPLLNCRGMLSCRCCHPLHHCACSRTGPCCIIVEGLHCHLANTTLHARSAHCCLAGQEPCGAPALPSRGGWWQRCGRR